ncbi:macrophage migration inhibitory factor (MIF) domain-containing protein [Ditylenchus destructor]|nr:macrophage migration inhibitory factor (MIF) domain-containing protein [Ditylenchus destructor]
MPIVSLLTNLTVSFTAEFRKSFMEVMAKALKMDPELIAFHLVTDKNCTLGVTDEPTVILNVKAVGFLSAEENIEHAKVISDFVESSLGVPSRRTLIHFENLQPHEVGIAGTTVAVLRGQGQAQAQAALLGK